LRTPALEQESYRDIARVPATLVRSRAMREGAGSTMTAPSGPAMIDTPVAAPAQVVGQPPDPVPSAVSDADQMTLF
jgi:hypothetical protein